MNLEREAQTGILPMKISKTGAPHEPLTEIIICDSLSGGNKFINEMPEQLSLLRLHTVDGKIKEHRAIYSQIKI